ncbi:hypothetical protein C5167_048257 [Papaver somniferum]|uniref:Uncharacterized protein n=1 Tax=Papaver somniferum TaxID=3469 RepID=A0A4Y7KLF0_PAPSO|nr:hypothetical protein C5167_048257 [Papaver somniferum]
MDPGCSGIHIILGGSLFFGFLSISLWNWKLEETARAFRVQDNRRTTEPEIQ